MLVLSVIIALISSGIVAFYIVFQKLSPDAELLCTNPYPIRNFLKINRQLIFDFADYENKVIAYFHFSVILLGLW